MGLSNSKAKARPRRNPVRQIYYDEHGNLRLGNSSRYTNKELKKLVKLEAAGLESVDEDADWFVVEVNWVTSWLAHVHFNKTSPAPGPCKNLPLLEVNEENTAFVPKPGLSIATKSNRGDYRLISEAMWKEICKLYPGSGPAITTKFVKNERHAVDGLYDTSGWSIDQSAFVKADHVKKHAASWFGVSSKTNASRDPSTASTTTTAAAAGAAAGTAADGTAGNGGGVSSSDMDPFATGPRKSESWKNKKRNGDESSLEEWLFK